MLLVLLESFVTTIVIALDIKMRQNATIKEQALESKTNNDSEAKEEEKVGI